MINIENIEVNNIEAAIRSVRNTLGNARASDSEYVYEGRLPKTKADFIQCAKNNVRFKIGRNDSRLLRKCLKNGDDSVMGMITVTMDITAPVYWWWEYVLYDGDTKKISQDLINMLTTQKITLDNFVVDKLIDEELNWVTTMEAYISYIDSARELYQDQNDKLYWYQLVQMVPMSFKQKMTVKTDFNTLRHIFQDKKDNKLDEWRSFCKIIVDNIPNGDYITMLQSKTRRCM